MNRKLLNLLLIIFTGLAFVGVGVITAADQPTVPDEVTIENEGYKEDKKPEVKLSHKKHNVEYKVACTECHHVFKDGENVWKEGEPVKKCAECHDPLEKKDNVMKLQNAYHKNCKDCHKELIAKNPESKAPFKKCTECHIKS